MGSRARLVVAAVALALLTGARGPLIVHGSLSGNTSISPLMVDSSGPSFDFNPAVRGSQLSNLDSTLCINGTCVAPAISCSGADAGASTWACTGDTLAIASSGTDPTLDQDTPLLSTDEAVLFNAGKVYEASANSIADIGTEDFVIEAVFEHTATGGAPRIISKLAATGWVFASTGTALQLYFVDAGGSILSTSAALVDRGWYHVMAFVDRSQNSADGARIYVNGAVSGAGANPSTRQLTLTTATKVAVGAESSTFGSKYDRRISLVRVWKSAAWLDTGAQATVALDRFSRLTGILPTVARGSAAPTVMTRASVGTLSKCTSNVTSLFLVGANWPRVSRDCSGRALYWSEPTITNTFLQSRDINTSWTKLDAGDTVGGSVTTPHGLTSTTAGLIADATDGDHGVTQAATVTAAVWTMSVIAKAGTKNFAYLSDDTVANATGFFNLSTCATGTKGAGGRELFAESLGNGWCRIGLSFTGTAAAHTFAIQSADDAASDKTVAGDGASVMTYFSEMQLELWPHPTTAFPTTTATAARSVDALSFASASNASTAKGSVVCSAVRPSHDATADGIPISINSGSTTGIVSLFLGISTDTARLDVWSGGVQQASVAGSTDIVDGTVHAVAGTWDTNDVRLFVDGLSQGTPDTVVTVPASFTTIGFGSALGGGFLGGGVQRCRIFPNPGVRQ